MDHMKLSLVGDSWQRATAVSPLSSFDAEAHVAAQSNYCLLSNYSYQLDIG